MKPTEAVELCRAVKAVCPAQAIDTHTPNTWWPLLQVFDLADCLAAVTVLGRTMRFIAPADIADRVRSVRDARLDATPVPVPPEECRAPAHLYLAYFKAAQAEIMGGGDAGQAVAAGVEAARAAVQLTAGRAPQAIESGRR